MTHAVVEVEPTSPEAAADMPTSTMKSSSPISTLKPFELTRVMQAGNGTVSSWTYPRETAPTKLVGDCISDTTWKEIWDATEKRMLATDDLRAQQEELVMDVEQECPLGCCLSVNSDYDDWYNSYWTRKNKLQDEIDQGWQTYLVEVAAKLSGSGLAVVLASEKQKKPVGNRPNTTNFYEENVVVGVRFEPVVDGEAEKAHVTHDASQSMKRI